jgi:hypothetical protein
MRKMLLLPMRAVLPFWHAGDEDAASGIDALPHP